MFQSNEGLIGKNFLMFRHLISWFKGLGIAHYLSADSRFGHFNVEVLKNKLYLEEKGIYNAHENMNLPPLTDDYDNTENMIVREMSIYYEKAEQHFELYADEKIKEAQEKSTQGQKDALFRCVNEARENFNNTNKLNSQNLERLRKELDKAEELKETFIEENDLTKRPPKIISEGKKRVTYSIIFFILAFETIGNGSFFANENGLAGGFALAFVPAILNAVLGYTLGSRFRQIYHIKKANRRNGWLIVSFIFSLIFTLNLGITHYRSAMEQVSYAQTMVEKTTGEENQKYKEILELGVEKISIQSLTMAPFDLSGVQSWLLFLLGIVCSLITAHEAFSLDDPYPGYGDAIRHYEKAQEDYDEKREEVVENLNDICEQAKTTLNETYQGLLANKSAQEVFEMINQAQEYEKDFLRYSDEIQSVGNQLLQIYRRAYQSIAGDKIPHHFKTLWEIPRKNTRVLSASIEEIYKSMQKFNSASLAVDFSNASADITKAYTEAINKI